MNINVSSEGEDAIITMLREEFETIINSVHDEIMIVDRNGKIIFVNQACNRFYDKKSNELIGCNVKILAKHGVFNPSVADIVLKTKTSETIVQTTKEGRKILVTGIPIKDKNNEVVKVVCNSRDLTELTLLNNRLEEIDRLFEQQTIKFSTLTTTKTGDELFYTSPQMELINNLAKKVAPSDINILILGESGVGKTMMANVIHNMSNRKNGPFQVINCSAIPDALLESELFGYAKGSFTGAMAQGKIGLFELAKGGTIFLDEIGDISPQLQVKLLQSMQDHKFRKIGGTTEIEVDFRIITATNQNLQAKMHDKQFREDLYYRINGISINIPPLRERKEDIRTLTDTFINRFKIKYEIPNKSLADSVMKVFYRYPWPGNIRELKSTIERLFLVVDNEVITVEDLPEEIRSNVAHLTNEYQLKTTIYPLQQALDMAERDLIKAAYVKYRTSYKVGKVLGISQSTAYRKLKRYIPQFNDE